MATDELSELLIINLDDQKSSLVKNEHRHGRLPLLCKLLEVSSSLNKTFRYQKIPSKSKNLSISSDFSGKPRNYFLDQKELNLWKS